MMQGVLPGMPAPDLGGEEDHWPTPPEAWEPFAPILLKAIDAAFGKMRGIDLLEPAAGRGGLLQMAATYLAAHRRAKNQLIAIELDPVRYVESDCRTPPGRVLGVTWLCADFLQTDLENVYAAEQWSQRVVLTNPPFSLATEFVERAIEWAASGAKPGVVAMLLPLDFAAGLDRAKRIHDRWPCSIYPLRSRPSFGNGQTGQRPVSWFLWDLAKPKREWRCL